MLLRSVYVLWSQVLSNADFIALVDAYHREARRRQTLSSAPPPSDAARVPFFDDLVDDQVVHAIDALPLSYRGVVVLRDIEDLHYAEVDRARRSGGDREVAPVPSMRDPAKETARLRGEHRTDQAMSVDQLSSLTTWLVVRSPRAVHPSRAHTTLEPQVIT